MSRPLYQVDVFTAEPFAGNPAAVRLLEGDQEPAGMQRVAAEMNLSETAFLRPAGGWPDLRPPEGTRLTSGPRRLAVDNPAPRTGGWATLPVGAPFPMG